MNTTARSVRGDHLRGWLVEPARPEWLRRRPKAHYYVLATVCVGAFMGQLDASIVTVAFPTLERAFHAGVASITWVGLSYLIVLVAGVTAVGRVSDMVGRKLLYTYGFVVFTLGSTLCAFAPTLVSLDGFRVIQAIGAAMLQANSVAIIYLAMPRDRLGRGIGIQGAAQALGLAFGPIVGGALLAAGGWRLIFLVNVPAGIAGTVAAWVFLPRSRDLQARTGFDWIGLGLFVPTVVALLVAVSFGGHWGWSSAPTVVLLFVAAASGAGFVGYERRCPDPMLDLSLLQRAPFATGVASGLLAYGVLFGTMFVVPFFLERARGAGPGQVGLTLTVLPLALGCIAPLAGRVAEHGSTHLLTVVGMTLTSGTLVVLGLRQPSGWLLIGELGLVGMGLGLFIPPNNAAIMASAPRTQAGMAGGVLNMTRGLGTALGLAFTSLVFGMVVAGQTSVSATSRGFAAAALFLAVVALVAAFLAAGLPGFIRLRSLEDAADPALWKWIETARYHLRPIMEAAARLRVVLDTGSDPTTLRSDPASDLLSACGTMLGWLGDSPPPRGSRGMDDGEIRAAIGVLRNAAFVFRSPRETEVERRSARAKACESMLVLGGHHIGTFLAKAEKESGMDHRRPPPKGVRARSAITAPKPPI